MVLAGDRLQGKSIPLMMAAAQCAREGEVAAHGSSAGTRTYLKENTGVSISLELLSNVALPLFF